MALGERNKATIALAHLEFDRAMGKVNDKDFADLDSRLRARALALMAQLDAAAPSEPIEQVPVGVVSVAGQCASCGTANDADARFCKQCGAKIA